MPRMTSLYSVKTCPQGLRVRGSVNVLVEQNDKGGSCSSVLSDTDTYKAISIEKTRAAGPPG